MCKVGGAFRHLRFKLAVATVHALSCRCEWAVPESVSLHSWGAWQTKEPRCKDQSGWDMLGEQYGKGPTFP